MEIRSIVCNRCAIAWSHYKSPITFDKLIKVLSSVGEHVYVMDDFTRTIWTRVKDDIDSVVTGIR